MPDPNQDQLSPEDVQALIHTQQQLYAAKDPRAEKLYNYITSQGYATKDDQGGLVPQVKSSVAPNSGGRTLTGEPAPGDTRNDFQRFADNINTPDPRREEWQSPTLNTTQDFGRHIVAPVLQTIAHPVNAATGMLQAVANSGGTPEGFGQQLVQPIIANTVQDYQEHGPVRAATNLAGTGIGTWAGGELGGAATKGIVKAAPVAADVMGQIATDDMGGAIGGRQSVTVPGQNYSASHAASFEGALAPATGMGRNFMPQEITPKALTPIRQTAARMAQGSPLEQVTVQAATDPSTPPLQRIKAYQGVVQGALNDLEAQHLQGLSSAANVPVDTSSLIRGLRSHISATTDAADVAAINNLIRRTQQVKTIDDLGTFRQELNNETSAEFKQSQIQAGRSGTSVQAASDLAGDVRSAYYDNLGKATGVDYSPLKLQESNLLTTKEALQNQQSSLAKLEAVFKAPSTFREAAGNVANIIQNPKTTITQTILRESPATRVSTLLKNSLSDLPSAPSSYPQLGPGAPSNQLPGAVQPPPQPNFYPDTAAARQGRLLPAKSGAPIIIGPDAARMSAGEQRAAMMQQLRRVPQAMLPAQAQPIRLPSSLEQLMHLRNGAQ